MNFKSRNKVSPDFNMSSMTDLVFLLLIFFILTSAVVTTSALDVILPKSKAQTVKKHDVTVTISEDMVFKVDGEIVAPEGIESAVLAKAAGNPDAVIILRVDKTVATGETVRILDIGYRNRLKMIIATDPND